MRYGRVFLFFFAWYVTSVALIFFATWSIETFTGGNRWPLLVLLMMAVGSVFFLVLKENFLSDYMGKPAMVAVLGFLLFCGFISFAYLSLLIFGA